MPETPTPAATDRVTLLSDQDLYLFNEGSNYRLYETVGAHLLSRDGQAGAMFSVWAPNARAVSMIGSFNDWNTTSHPLTPRGSSGIWEGFIPGVAKGALYKFHIESRSHGEKRILRRSRNVILNLRDQRGHQIEVLVNIGKLVQQLHHPVIILERVQPRPRQTVFARHQILVKRLVLMPEKNQPQSGHGWNSQSSMGIQLSRRTKDPSERVRLKSPIILPEAWRISLLVLPLMRLLMHLPVH